MSDLPQNQPDQVQTMSPRTTNGFAVASLVLGIVFVGGIGSILALVFGYLAKNQIDRSHGVEGGRGMAIAGIVLGWVGVAVVLLMILLMVIGVMAMPPGPMGEMMNDHNGH